MVNGWTRDDLPSVADLVKASVAAMATELGGGADAALDAVVEHLNEHHPKPQHGLLSGAADCVLESADRVKTAEADRDRWRRAHEIVEQERDQARESLRRLRDETDFDLFTVRDQLKQCRGEREQMTRDRDEWKARADKWHGAWQKSAPARTTPAVTKADIEKAIRDKTWAANREPNRAGFHRVHIEWATDAVWSLVSGADPVVYVVRESDLPEVERDEDGDWLCENLVVNRRDTAEDLRGRALSQLKHVAMREAVARAVEAEQAVDPVEELAGQIEAATRTAIRQACDGLTIVAPSLDPLTVERAMEVTAASRKVAAHVLGQEAGQ